MPTPSARALRALAMPVSAASTGSTFYPAVEPPAGANAHDLEVAEFVPFSTADWPGHVVATVYLQGCSWRCTYCFNPSWQSSQSDSAWQWADVVAWMADRKGLLHGVVFSGGEPTRQSMLMSALAHTKEMGYKTGLHTAGPYPARLQRVLPLVDWVAIDIKGTPKDYAAITGVPMAGEHAWRSLDILKDSGADYEVRITVDPTVHTRDGILGLVDTLTSQGVTRVVLQEARAALANPEYAEALGERGITDVLTHGDLHRLHVR